MDSMTRAALSAEHGFELPLNYTDSIDLRRRGSGSSSRKVSRAVKNVFGKLKRAYHRLRAADERLLARRAAEKYQGTPVASPEDIMEKPRARAEAYMRRPSLERFALEVRAAMREEMKAEESEVEWVDPDYFL